MSTGGDPAADLLTCAPQDTTTEPTAVTVDKRLDSDDITGPTTVAAAAVDVVSAGDTASQLTLPASPTSADASSPLPTAAAAAAATCTAQPPLAAAAAATAPVAVEEMTTMASTGSVSEDTAAAVSAGECESVVLLPSPGLVAAAPVACPAAVILPTAIAETIPATTTTQDTSVAVDEQQTQPKSHKRKNRSAAEDSVGKKHKHRKKDDDDDEDSECEQLKGSDSERLKAFNMFVRLFVDENLDRVSPISKQPKEKIQAILDACDRQFPEFHVRSRKRIRTYLKSCRRLRRVKGFDDALQARQTLPHLTSAEAETILAQACENESSNAKRMRMGLDPLSATEMAQLTSLEESSLPGDVIGRKVSSPSSTDTASSQPDDDNKPLELTSSFSSRTATVTSALGLLPPCPVDVTLRPTMVMTSRPDVVSMNGCIERTGLLLGTGAAGCDGIGTGIIGGLGLGAGLGTGYLTVYQTFFDANAAMMQTDPTDLSIKREPTVAATFSPARTPSTPVTQAAAAAAASCGTVMSVSLSTSSLQTTTTTATTTSVAATVGRLSASEVSTIRQLIAGYRESAAFLTRSADELQQLIFQQNT